MSADRTTDTHSDDDKFATTKQAASSPAPLALQLRNASFPITFGRYKLLRVLGEGSMGGVYLGQDTQLQRDVAIKIPKFDKTDRGAIQRFQREARAMATLRHANLCPVYDVGQLDGVQYFTMAYIEGDTLAKHLSAGKALPGREVALLILKLAQSVEEAHQRGIVHRDLKPANIIIDQNKEPVIMDFGLARLAEATSNLTQSGLMIGTPAYMAPEQVRGELESICPASDIYSLGAIMYEMLTGKLAFDGSIATVVKQTLATEPERPSDIAPGIPSGLDAICLKAMSKDPRDRYPSGAAMAAAIRSYLKQSRESSAKTVSAVGEPPPVVPLSAFAAPSAPTTPVNSLASLQRHRRRRASRRPWLLWSAGATTAVVLLLAVWFVFLRPSDAESEAPASPLTAQADRLAPAREAAAPDPPEHTAAAPGRPPPFEGPPGRTAAEIIQDFDRDHDGMLQEAEIPIDQHHHLMRADADDNRIVDEEELDVFLILFRPPPR